MPCFYCGKRVSLVRQMSDADFCSDEHRKRYHALTRLAFKRLLENEPQPAKPEVRPPAPRAKKRPAHQPAPAPAAPAPQAAALNVTITQFTSPVFDEVPASKNGHDAAKPPETFAPPVAERTFAPAPPNPVNPASLLQTSAIGCGRSAPRPELPRVSFRAGTARMPAGPDFLGTRRPEAARELFERREVPALSLRHAASLPEFPRLSFRAGTARMPAGPDHLVALMPEAMRVRFERREVPALSMRGPARLPVCRFVPVGSFTAQTDPALCETWMTVPPRVAAFASSGRNCAAAEFHAGAASLPGFAAALSTAGLPQAGLQSLGCPAAARLLSTVSSEALALFAAVVRFPRIETPAVRGRLCELPWRELSLPQARNISAGTGIWALPATITVLSTPLALRAPQALAGTGTVARPSLAARPCSWMEVPPRPVRGVVLSVDVADEAAFAPQGVEIPGFKTAEAPETDVRGGLLEGRSFEQYPAPAPRGACARATSAVIPPREPHAVEIPATAFSGAALQLAAAGEAGSAACCAVDLARARTQSAWIPFSPMSPGLGTLASRVRAPRWQAAANEPFLDALERGAHPVAPGTADATAQIGFAGPMVRHPELAAHTIALGETNPAALPKPGVRLDVKAAASKGRITPAFRLSSRPSRFPVFRARVEKAHMPHGAFCTVELDDHDSAAAAAPACTAMASGPAWPEAEFALDAYETLEAAAELPVDAGPYAGTAQMAGGPGEQPYTPELFFVATELGLLGMDFESILETDEPRWRSALKTASGLFRGVMVFIPAIIALSSMLTGCAANGSSLNRELQSRAAIRVEHDFSTGMNGWYGGRNWAQSWVREPGSGYIRAGQLALYRPSQPLTNYRLEFLGQIRGSSIGWVYRAADLQNYYVSKLLVVKHGPSPEMALERYQVVAGRETAHVRVPVRKLMHNGRPYRIQQDVEGNGFQTSIEGEVVDYWTDDRLRTGGVGFFGEAGDTPHLYWARVTYHDDFWGKICAAIAPNN
ncbi:MAG: hypothetical protein ACM336_15185 [Acidobacteriota bacterium]